MRDALANAVWYGDGFGAIVARAALTPCEWFYGAASWAVGAQRARQAGAPLTPTISIGNITVGGTGKTPMSAWVAGELRQRGRRPALLLRGYGDDEPLVHAMLNPGMPVIADPDRQRGAAAALAEGANALVLDDGFQHRQMPRTVDIVLLSADQWHDGAVRLLPTGPFREPLSALRRASLIIVTRKLATAERAAEVAAIAQRAAGDVATASVWLSPGRLCTWSGDEESLDALCGRRVLAVSGIAAPHAFGGQLRALGATVDTLPFDDHHAYSGADIKRIVDRSQSNDLVVCTLKDAVKLAPRWPAEAPRLRYLSQLPEIENGAAELRALLDRLASPNAR